MFFFDPQKSKFIDTASAWISPERYLLDAANHLYCDFSEGKGMCDNVHSHLYTIKNFQRTDLFDLQLYNCTSDNNNTNTITALILSRKINENNFQRIDSQHLAKPLLIGTENYFDYKAYWRSRYRELLGVK